jgi:hypothetical protein
MSLSSALSTLAPSALSSALASSTPSSNPCFSADFTTYPTNDTACAVGSQRGDLASNTGDILEKCCGDAPVEEFNGECGFYCLSVKQPIADLQACFMEGGIKPADIFCNANNSATATGEPTKGTSPSKSGGAAASGTAGGDQSAAAGVRPRGLSKTGLGVLAMVVVSAFAGAML